MGIFFSRAIRTTVVIGLLLGAVAACSASGSPTAATDQSGRAPASAGTGNGANSGATKLSDSKYLGLTKLDQPHLCGVMNASEATGILGKATSAPNFTNTIGLGIVCEWQAGSASNELYLGVSTILDWKAAKAIATTLHGTDQTVAGHSAMGAAPQGRVEYAFLDVAVSGDHDPAIEYRAPTLAMATSLATLTLPRLIALSGS